MSGDRQSARQDAPVKLSPSINTDTVLASGRRVLGIESDALAVLAKALNGDFCRAVEIIDRAPGRVVVTGMGKSGHVGRKIAATLASTGRPAFFVHPAEASHGDLGMVTADDVVLALSNSGEVPELRDIISYARRFGIPLIGMTSGAKSSLASASDVALILPPVSEACAIGLAPTTSTTMMIALGDALAVAVMELRNFTASDYKVFHPGGQLGRRLLKVVDLMHTGDSLPVVGPDAPMTEVIVVMTAKSLGCAGVVDGDGTLLGVITDGDLRRHMQDNLLANKARDVMTRDPRTVGPDLLAAEALRVMNTNRPGPISSVFVVDGNTVVGVLHVHDCLRSGVA